MKFFRKWEMKVINTGRVSIFILLFIVIIVSAYTDYKGTMNDFMGVNVHAQLYFDHYNGTYVDYNMSLPFRWVRNYHPWEWFESVNDTYQWNFTGEGKWKWFDNYYQKLNQDSINLLICVMSPPSWVIGGKISFHDNGNGSSEDNYRESAEYIAQLAARYGRTGGLPADKIETSDKIQGLDYCRYFEDSNEPDQWWESADWNPVHFGKFLNAVHDGHGVSITTALPIAGVKQGDQKAFHVLGGMANNALTKTAKFDGSYLDTAVKATGRSAKEVLDVINFHQYWNTTDSIPWPWTGAVGVSPENGIYERKDSSITKLKKWRDINAPGVPIWLTEFGWDTYTAGGTDHSYQYAPELQQANYIMRSFALLKKEGLDKAFVYFDQDPKSSDIVQYSSSGLVKDKTSGYARKQSFFFMTTMRKVIGDYYFDGTLKHAEGNPQVYVYRYLRTSGDIVLMVWCRDPKSNIDNGTVLANYRINVPGMISCTQVKPKENVLEGESISLSVTDSKSLSANVIVPAVSETPLFLKIASDVSTETRLKEYQNAPELHPYHIAGRTITFCNIPQDHVITISRLNGVRSWTKAAGKKSQYTFVIQPGLYIYTIKGKTTTASGTFLIYR
jgi:hypothetical protein